MYVAYRCFLYFREFGVNTREKSSIFHNFVRSLLKDFLLALGRAIIATSIDSTLNQRRRGVATVRLRLIVRKT